MPWNPSDKNAAYTLSDNNRVATATNTAWKALRGTIGRSSGKRSFAIAVISDPTTSHMFGVATASASLNNYVGADIYGWGYHGGGQKAHNGSFVSYGATFAGGDVINVDIDIDAGTLAFRRNNVSQGTAYSGLPAGTYFPAAALYYNSTSCIVYTTLADMPYPPATGYTAWDYEPPANYTITASAGSHGSITPSGSVSVVSGGNQSFVITPDALYRVADVIVDSVSVGAVDSYNFTNVTTNHTISASFELVPVTHTITASAGSHGSIDPSGSVSVVDGNSQSFTIAAAPGYVVADVLVDSVSVGAVGTYTFQSVSTNHTIAASFSIEPWVRPLGDGEVLCRSIPMSRTLLSVKTGLSVDTMDIEIFPRSTDLLAGVSLQAAAQAGILDGATVSVFRVFWQDGVDGGGVVIFSGRAGEIEADRSKIGIPVNSFVELLNVQMPRNVYQASCQWTLYGPGCCLDAEDYTFTGTIGSGATRISIPVVGFAQDDGYFNYGYIWFQSGAMEGRSFSITKHASNTITPLMPLPVAPSEGDEIALIAGCDRTLSICTDKFNNKASFPGCPFIPVPQTAGV